MKLKIRGDIYDNYPTDEKRVTAIFKAILKTGIDENTAKNILKFAVYENAPYYFDVISCAGDLCDMFLKADNYMPDTTKGLDVMTYINNL